jgi:hypothetical protein
VEGGLALTLDRGQQEAHEQGGNTYTHSLQEREVGQPIILSDTDILSFSIDHGALNISTGSHASSHFFILFFKKKCRTKKILKFVDKKTEESLIYSCVLVCFFKIFCCLVSCLYTSMMIQNILFKSAVTYDS